MTTRYFGAPIPRNEDRRLLTGKALFVDDVELPGMLHAALLRSPLAHARIRKVDVSAALARAGVIAAYTARARLLDPRTGLSIGSVDSGRGNGSSPIFGPTMSMHLRSPGRTCTTLPSTSSMGWK